MIVQFQPFAAPFIVSALLAANVSLAADARECLEIPGDAERLACYDSAFGRRSVAVPASPGVPAVADATVTVASPASEASAAPILVDPVAEFGLSESQKRAQNPERAKDVSPERITAKVSEVGRQPTGGLLVTLENGQVWAQAESLSKARVAAGDEVTIRKATLGSYLLLAPNKVAMRVRRVR
jgi:hypothetical protein